MPTFNALYDRLVRASVNHKTEEELEKLRQEDFDSHQLDCLLNPEKYPTVWRVGDCNCSQPIVRENAFLMPSIPMKRAMSQ